MIFPSFAYRVRWEVKITTEEQLKPLLDRVAKSPNLFYRGMPNENFIALTSFYRYYLKKYSPKFIDQHMGYDGHLKVNLPQIDQTHFINESFKIIDEFLYQLKRRGVSLGLPLKSIIGLAQHYGLPTNLLDFTKDPLVALYFATEPDKWNENKNCVVYESDIDISKKFVATLAAEGKLGYFQDLNGYDEIYNHFIKTFSTIERGDIVTKVPKIEGVDKKFNRRINSQDGVFIYNPNCHPYDVEMYNVYDEPYQCLGRQVYVIDANLKPYIRKFLSDKNINKEHIYPNNELDLNKSILESSVRFTKAKLNIPTDS